MKGLVSMKKISALPSPSGTWKVRAQCHRGSRVRSPTSSCGAQNKVEVQVSRPRHQEGASTERRVCRV